VGFGKVLLRGRPVETGDKAFDESVVVRSGREPERAMLYLGNSAHRQTLLQLLHQEGVLLVRFTEKGVLLIKGGDFLGKGAIAPDKILEYLGYAGRLLGR